MASFEFLTRPNFKRLEDGSWAYFPNGFLGRGYILASETAREEIHRTLVASTALGISAVLASQIVWGAGVSIVVAALWLAALLAWQRRRVRGLPVTSERLSFHEATAHSSWALWIVVPCALLILGVSVHLYLNGRSRAAIPPGLVGFVLLLFACWGLRHNHKQRGSAA